MAFPYIMSFFHASPTLPVNEVRESSFEKLDSSKLVTLDIPIKIFDREDFLKINWTPAPPRIGKSAFVPANLLEHLMRNKKDQALGVKYTTYGEITNMEGALHTFVTPLCKANMIGDYHWKGYLDGDAFGRNQVRPVILSAAIQPDFEYETIMMHLIKVDVSRIEGKSLPADFTIPSKLEKQNPEFREVYDERLKQHMIAHLTQSKTLPSLEEVTPDKILDKQTAISFIEKLIKSPVTDISSVLKDKFLRIDKHVLSLEMLFHVYLHQIRNEFALLEEHQTQGYVYTIDPPSIFARCMGGAVLLNRLQAAALKEYNHSVPLKHLKQVGFNDYADRSAIEYYHEALPGILVTSKSSLFSGPNGTYVGPEGYALVIHNNSDAFGQNIETEGASSLDGVIGSFSDAACVLKRDRKDLLDHAN